MAALPIARQHPKSSVAAIPINRQQPKSIVAAIPIDKQQPKTIVAAISINRQQPKSIVACGRQGTSGMHPRGFHYLIFILMIKRILLLALMSSRAAVGFAGIRSGSYVVGRSGERGHPAAAGQQHFVSLFLSPWIHRSGSQAVDMLPWIGGGTGNADSPGVNSPVLGDHLTSWDQNPKVLLGRISD